MALHALLKTRIAEVGAISLTEYMALALSHPEYGYYMTRDPLGEAGDFTTAPEISQIFGELTGLWLGQQWLAQGSPSPALLVELGPGRGTLMRDILRATAMIPGFHDALSIRLVEISPVLKARQEATLAGAHSSIEWLASIEGLPALPCFLIANEFFDALPIQQWVATPEGEVERAVTLQNGRFAFTPEGMVTREACPPSLTIMSQLAQHITQLGGAMLAIDYGYSAGEQGDTLQAVFQHHNADPLEAPGEADITAHVDFLALAKVAHHAGAIVHGPVTQGRWLTRLGAELRAAQLSRTAPHKAEHIQHGVERLVAPHHMGDVFKVMAVTPPHHPRAEGF